MIASDTQASIKLLLKETEQSDYFEKYQHWSEFLKKCKAQSDESYLVSLEIFLEYFPYNYQFWMEYIQLTHPDNYQVALKRNGKSFELWENYLQYIKTTPIYEDKPKYRKEVEKAIMEVGADCRAGPIYLEYFQMLNENYRYEFFKKIFIRALHNLEEIDQLFKKWFESQSEEQLSLLVAKQTKGKSKNLQAEEMRQFLTHEIIQTKEKTLAYREKRIKLESRINHFYFSDKKEEIWEDQLVWRELIDLERKNGVVENTSYCYERMLMAQTHDIDLWEEVIHFLENQTNKYAKVLNIFRFNRAFFMKFNRDLYFYWCDLEERESANEARKMYVELQKEKKSVEIVLRHIQFEIRDKKWENAKNLYDALIAQYQENIEDTDLLCYILVEYSNFVVKYYKDFQYPKKLLKSYFDYLPYNHFLFTNYLNLLKNFEYKEGYYDELMTVIMEGLKKAKKVMNDEQFDRKVLRMSRQHLRTVLGSIYLIKMSERKLMEMEYDKV